MLRSEFKNNNNNEFHPLELENTITSISITASQNLKKNQFVTVSNSTLKPENNFRESQLIEIPQVVNKNDQAETIKKSNDKVERIANSIKRNFSNKKIPVIKNFDSSKKTVSLNDGFRGKSLIKYAKDSLLTNNKNNSKYPSNNISFNNSFKINKTSLNNSAGEKSKDKCLGRKNSYKITI